MMAKDPRNTKRKLTRARAAADAERVAPVEFRLAPRWRKQDSEMRKMTEGCDLDGPAWR